MGRVLTNNTSLEYAEEQSLGVLPGSPSWKTLEPNDISTFGSTLTTVPREPISKNRQRKKGAVTDLDSAVEFSADLTMDHFIDFAEAFVFADFIGPEATVPTAVVSGASGGYTIPAISSPLASNTLVYADGFEYSSNNGLKVVATASTTTLIRVDGLTQAEASPPTSVSVDVCGVRGAAGDIEIDASGNIISTALDFTTLGLTVGQSLWLGGVATINRFTTDADRGYVRIVAVSASEIQIDKTGQTFSADAGTGKEIDLYFGRFLRNVSIDHSDYKEASFTFEAAYEGLQNPSGDEYEYAVGNYCNTLGVSLPLTDKATLEYSFVGTDTDVPTTTRATGAATPIDPSKTGAYSTTIDTTRIRIQEVDETGLTTDFKNLTLTLNNNVSPEKVIGTLGAKYMNTGNFNVDVEGQILFTEGDVVDAIRNNTTVTMDFAVRNDNGSIHIDIPSMTLGDGSKDFPVNESVLANLSGMAFEDGTLGTSIGISILPFSPAE